MILHGIGLRIYSREAPGNVEQRLSRILAGMYHFTLVRSTALTNYEIPQGGHSVSTGI